MEDVDVAFVKWFNREQPIAALVNELKRPLTRAEISAFKRWLKTAYTYAFSDGVQYQVAKDQ